MIPHCNLCNKICAIADQDNPDEYRCVECMNLTSPDLKKHMQEVEAHIVLNHHYKVDINIVN